MKTNETNCILLIEDDVVDREAVHRLLDDSYYLIDAEHGKEGLEIAARQHPACVLLDYRLPDVDGLEIVPDLVATDIPVIMMTSVGNESTAVEAMKAGATDYITKDELSMATLRNAINHAIEAAQLNRKLCEQREELESFVSAAAHDLRAPMRHIASLTEFAKNDLESDKLENLGRYLDQICDAGTRMEALLDSLVRFARSGRSETPLEPVDLGGIVAQATDNLSVAIDQADAVIKYANLPTVWGHEPSLIELMQNLIGNAIKYSGESNPNVEIGCSAGKEDVTIRAGDNGIGIPPQFVESIFDPFRRLHAYDAIEGSGIGLASCKRIIKHHRGKIWAESTVGEGSTFYFTLQLAVESRHHSPSQIVDSLDKDGCRAQLGSV